MTAANTESTSKVDSFGATELTLALTVKDVATSVRWYHEVLGFAIDQQMEREGQLVSVAIKSGNIRMRLNKDDGGRGWDRTKGEGIGLMLITKDVDATAARIKAAGGTLASEPADMPWGARVFRVVDPDGYRFAIST